MTSEKKMIDWELIERLYRAGMLTVRQIATEHGLSHTAIQKRAAKFGWERDLTQKIQQATQKMVATQVVAKSVATEAKLTDAATIKAYAEVATAVDILNRDDITLGMDVSRGQLQETAAISNRDVVADLAWLAKTVAQAKIDQGTRPETVARLVDMFENTISLPGRVKLSKDIAAVHAVYIPMQRKIFKLDGEADKNQANIDTLLAQISAAQ